MVKHAPGVPARHFTGSSLSRAGPGDVASFVVFKCLLVIHVNWYWAKTAKHRPALRRLCSSRLQSRKGCDDGTDIHTLKMKRVKINVFQADLEKKQGRKH
jgi:hypothetical protein